MLMELWAAFPCNFHRSMHQIHNYSNAHLVLKVINQTCTNSSPSAQWLFWRPFTRSAHRSTSSWNKFTSCESLTYRFAFIARPQQHVKF